MLSKRITKFGQVYNSDNDDDDDGSFELESKQHVLTF